MAIRSDMAIDWQTDPRLITVADTSDELSIQDQVDTLRDAEDKPENEVYEYLIDAAGKEDLGGGVLVGITSSMNNAQIAFAARTASISAGSVTSVDAAGETLIDSAATFESDGVEVGAIIINFTDLSVATALTVDSEIQISHEPLDDGTNDDWTMGDVYKIWNYTTCELSGGNAVAEDENGVQIDVLQPRFGVSYVRTSSSSATLQGLEADTIASAVWDAVLLDHIVGGSVGEALFRTLGLTQENYYLDNTSYTDYSGMKLLTSGRIRIYSDPASVGGSSDVVATYQITAAYSGDELTSYSVVKQ